MSQTGYPEGGAEAMTGQSTLDLASSAETDDQLYAGSQQPLLQPQVADTTSAAAWEALTSLAKDPDTFAFPPSETPTRLFDGHSFAGWSGKIGRYWTIENGAIKAIMSPYDAPPVSTYLFSGACRALAFLSRHHHSHTHAMVS